MSGRTSCGGRSRRTPRRKRSPQKLDFPLAPPRTAIRTPISCVWSRSRAARLLPATSAKLARFAWRCPFTMPSRSRPFTVRPCQQLPPHAGDWSGARPSLCAGARTRRRPRDRFPRLGPGTRSIGLHGAVENPETLNGFPGIANGCGMGERFSPGPDQCARGMTKPAALAERGVPGRVVTALWRRGRSREPDKCGSCGERRSRRGALPTGSLRRPRKWPERRVRRSAAWLPCAGS